MRTILWFIHFWLYQLALLPSRFKARRLAKAGNRAAHDAVVRKAVGPWARSMIRTAGGTVSVEGLENMPEEPAVYVSNHRSYFDIPLVLGYLGDDTKPLVAKKEIGKIPLIRAWMEELHCVFLDRDNPREAIKNIKEAEYWVAEGYSMVVFPEGTRTKDGYLGEFKPGAFKIAQNNKVPVVPFCMKDTDKLMGRDNLWIHPAHVAIKVLPPIDTEDYTRADWKNLPKLAEEKVREGLEAMDGEGFH